MMTLPMRPLVGRQNFIGWLYDLGNYLDRMNLKDTLLINPTNEDKCQAAMDTIRYWVDKSQHFIINDCIYPKQAINMLKRYYFPNTLLNHSQIRSEIEKTTHGGIGTTEIFILKICRLFKELRFSGAIINDREIMSTIYHKLAPEFGQLLDSLEHSGTIKVFVNRIIQFDKDTSWNNQVKEMAQRNQFYLQQLQQFHGVGRKTRIIFRAKQ